MLILLFQMLYNKYIMSLISQFCIIFAFIFFIIVLMILFERNKDGIKNTGKSIYNYPIQGIKATNVFINRLIKT